MSSLHTINWPNNLPGQSTGIIAQTVASVIPNAISNNALSINDADGAVVAFRSDGIIETRHGSISIEEWIETIKLMRQFAIDISNDPELSERYPYMKEAAHRWLMNSLRK